MAEPPKPPDTSPLGVSPQDALAFMQRMWNPFGVPIPGFGLPGAPGAATPPGTPGASAGAAAAMPFVNPALMFAALDPLEVERKIGELRIIEAWLQVTLNMMQMSIKTLELQKASLEAMRGAQAAEPGSGSGTGGKG
jgi:hypothetical protein